MKGPGILWMLQTAAGMSMAGPMFFLSFESLRSGRYAWGIGFLVFGTFVLYFPTYLVNRIGGPRTWIRRRLDRIGGPRTWIRRRLGRIDSATDDGTNVDAEPTDGDESETATDRTTILDRLRR